MDEPTAALGVKESREVLDLIRRLRDQGTAIMVVAHNLLHVLSIADRIMVLRHGRSIGIKEKSQTSLAEIEEMIIGSEND